MKIDKMLFGGGCCVSNTDTDFESDEVKLSKTSKNLFRLIHERESSGDDLNKQAA